MAESHPRAGTRKKRRPARALLLTSAILAIVFGGLFIARSANAAPVSKAALVSKAVPAATAATGAHAATAATSGRSAVAGRDQLAGMATAAEPGGTICNLPAVGDLGSLVGLCQAGVSGLIGDVNSVCTDGPPEPEIATSGINSMISTPGAQTTGKTLYDNYAMAGQFWATYGLSCSQLTSSIGNNVASIVFDMAKSLDRVTITIYQSAANANILTWLSSSVDNLIGSLGRAIYYPFLAPVVIVAAMWLAWQGLGRKRATRTIEGTIWMVLACVAAIWLIGRPGDFTNIGTTVSNGTTSVLNAAFSNLPAKSGADCLPVGTNDPQSEPANYAFTGGNGLVDQNAEELWTVLVCKPWLEGEFGTTQYATAANQPQTLVNQYGRELLWAQAVAANETQDQNTDTNKQDVYQGIAADLKASNPAVYSLFQGDQWTTRLEIGFTALFAAVAAGLLILLIALTLIMLKLGFLLLLVAGPFFLIVGIHPGFGRVIAVRWFEMLVGVLLKQVAVALTLSVLLYCYSLIMGTPDVDLGWALKIMMIALVTVTVFIYRKPFQHLFSSVGYGMLGSDERAQVNWRESSFGFRRVTANAAGVVIPGMGTRVTSRWARRGAPDAGGAADPAAAGGGVAAAGATIPEGMSVGPASDSHVTGRQWPDAGVGSGGRAAPPLPLSPQGGPPVSGPPAGWARTSATGTGASVRQSGAQPTLRQSGGQPAVRQGPAPARTSRPATGSGWPGTASPTRSGSSNGAAGGAAKPPAPPFWARSRRRSK